MSKFKMRWTDKASVNVPKREEDSAPPDERKNLLPDDAGDDPGRRRNYPAITFYDLAQVKSGDTWIDHPILKTPSYSYEPSFPLQTIIIEPFETRDYAAYEDRLFQFPVETWKDNYRKLEWQADPTPPEKLPYPTNLSEFTLNDATPFMTYRKADIGSPAGRALRTSYLNNYHIAWTSRGLEYRALDDLYFRHYYDGFGGPIDEWFWMSLALKGDAAYKVTASRNSSASDVGPLNVSGSIEIYLVPHVVIFLGTSYLSLGNGFSYPPQILGPWYQVLPRANWVWRTDVGVGTPAAGLQQAFVEYQCSRAGAQASVFDGAPLDPTGFLGNTYCQISHNNSVIGPVSYPDSFFLFKQADSSPVSRFYRCSNPVLMAVVKLHGQFYYVWGTDLAVASSNGRVSEYYAFEHAL